MHVVPSGTSECRVLAAAAVLQRRSLTFGFVCPAPVGPLSGVAGQCSPPGLKGETLSQSLQKADMTAAAAGSRRCI